MKKIVIIGAGMAGLSAGIHAKQNGYDVEIYEKQSRIGGMCAGWKRKGFYIDNCIHWLVGTQKSSDLYLLWKNLNALNDEIKIISPSFLYTSELNGQRITLWRDLERTRSEMCEISPEDKDEINKLINDIKNAESIKVPITRNEKLSKEDGEKYKRFCLEYNSISIRDLSNKFRSPLIRNVLTDYFCDTFIAAHFVYNYAEFTKGNADIPEGGSMSLTNRMIERFNELGGKIYTSSTVKKIIVENEVARGILLDNGTIIEGDFVIAACDMIYTYLNLIDDKYMNKRLAKKLGDIINNPIDSSFQVAFSIDKNLLATEGLFITDCAPISILNSTVNRLWIKNYSTYEVSSRDSEREIIQCSFIQSELDFENWKLLYKSQDEYKKVKEQVANDILKRILDKFPQYSDDINIIDIWTPMTYYRYCNSYKGSYIGFVETKFSSKMDEKNKVKGIHGLYVASQWMASFGGLPMSMLMGKYAIDEIELEISNIEG